MNHRYHHNSPLHLPRTEIFPATINNSKKNEVKSPKCDSADVELIEEEVMSSVVEVSPIVIPPPSPKNSYQRNSRHFNNDANDMFLSPPMIKLSLMDLCGDKSHLTGKNGSILVRWDDIRNEEEHDAITCSCSSDTTFPLTNNQTMKKHTFSTVLSGTAFLHAEGYQQDEKNIRDNMLYEWKSHLRDYQATGINPWWITFPSENPTNLRGVPCLVRIFSTVTTVHTTSKHNSTIHASKQIINKNRLFSKTINAMIGSKVKLKQQSIITYAKISSGTLVRVLPPIIPNFYPNTKTKSPLSVPLPPPTFPSSIVHNVTVQESLLGEVGINHVTNITHNIDKNSSTNNCNFSKLLDEDDYIMTCHDQETVNAITNRMATLLEKPVLVGTTQDAFQKRNKKLISSVKAHQRIRLLFDHSYKENITKTITNNKLPTTHNMSNQFSHNDIIFEDSAALTLHDSFHASGKTSLVKAIARKKLGCSSIHVIQGSSALFAKYGASGADVAFESLIHNIAISGAVTHTNKASKNERDTTQHHSDIPKICIILDHLDTFTPYYSRKNPGDPSIPALHAIAAYLSKLTHSINKYREIPYPSQNLMHNIGGKDGYSLPLKLCLIGILTYNDQNQKRSYGNDNQPSSLLETLGRNRYCLTPTSQKGRYNSFLNVFRLNHIRLNKEAMDRLPSLAASATNARGRSFQQVATKLKLAIAHRIRVMNLGEQNDMTRIEATAGDLERAMKCVQFGHYSSFDDGSTIFEENDSMPSARSSKLSWSNSHPREKATLFCSSVGGNYNAKVALEDALAIDERKRCLLAKFDLSPPTGVLLYGPPGTGKTLLGRAVAKMLRHSSKFSTHHKNANKAKDSASINLKNDLGGAFITLNASDIVRSEVGASEKLLVDAFETARKNSPSVVFIDEFQALFTSRDGDEEVDHGGGAKGSGRLTSTLLQCMDDVTKWRKTESMAKDWIHNNDSSFTQALIDKEEAYTDENIHVVVLGATNAPWMVDKAFLRPGRFDRLVHVGLPDLLEREAILRLNVQNMKLSKEKSIDESSLCETICKKMASLCDGFSGADLVALCHSAAIASLTENGSSISVPSSLYVQDRHFLLARTSHIQNSSSIELVSKLKKWKP